MASAVYTCTQNVVERKSMIGYNSAFPSIRPTYNQSEINLLLFGQTLNVQKPRITSLDPFQYTLVFFFKKS